MKKSILLTIAITTAAILWFTSGNAQVSIQAGAGYKNSLAGHLAVSYAFKQVETSTTMLSLPFRKATYFSQSIGYVFESNEWQVKPYGGITYKLVGNTNTEDRYIKDGVTQVLARNQEINEWMGSFGLQVVKGYVYADLNYTRGFSAAIGLRYTFNR